MEFEPRDARRCKGKVWQIVYGNALEKLDAQTPPNPQPPGEKGVTAVLLESGYRNDNFHYYL